MGLILKPAEVKNCTKQMRSQIESNRNSYAEALQTVQNFVGNDSFKSESWDTLKGKYVGSHQLINRGMVAVYDSIQVDFDTMDNVLADAVDTDEDMLLQDILRLEEECNRYIIMIKKLRRLITRSMIAGVSTANTISSLINHYQEMLQKAKDEMEILKEKLNELYEKTEQTSSLFQTVGTLLGAIECAINDAEVYISGSGTLSDESWVTVIPEMVEKINSSLEQDEVGNFVGYLKIGAKEITENGGEGFFKVYDAPTLTSIGDQYYFQNIYEECGIEPRGALQAFCGGDSILNKSGKSQYGGQELDPYKGTLVYNGMERYAIAIGPKLQNPNCDMTKELNASEMAYGTCVDVEIMIEGNTYYIPAIIVDVKGCTYPNGFCQTGKDHAASCKEEEKNTENNNGKNSPSPNIVEWYTYQYIDDQKGQQDKNISASVRGFNDASIIIYRDEVLP